MSETERDEIADNRQQVAVVEQLKLPEIKTTARKDEDGGNGSDRANYFLPDEVMQALRQKKPDKSVPLSTGKISAAAAAPASSRRPPAQLWFYSKQREKFAFLVNDNNSCNCGAGKDVSFLYDCPPKQDKSEPIDKLDKSQHRRLEAIEERKKKPITLPDTILPEEFHVVKNQGTIPLKLFQDPNTVLPEEHSDHITLFPSMNPVSRHEVKQLKHVMEEMLKKLGVDDETVELKGPTQLHNLLEIVKKEQNIYNVIFHEIIRQISVECVERGELLSILREKYSNLINRIPRQLVSLHNEVIAQRALDRRLSDELASFKNTIATLTDELTRIKEHDQQVTKEATEARNELHDSMRRADKSAAMLTEYHELYELQRNRLETHVDSLMDEKDMWLQTAYTISTKVIEENNLINARKCYQLQKAWQSLATHFCVMLSERDANVLASMSQRIEEWQDSIQMLLVELQQDEGAIRKKLNTLRDILITMKKKYLNEYGEIIEEPTPDVLARVNRQIPVWMDSITVELEKTTGENALTKISKVKEMLHLNEKWCEQSLYLYNFHKQPNGDELQSKELLGGVSNDIEMLLDQLSVRVTGENGIGVSMARLVSLIDIFLSSFVKEMGMSEWRRLLESIPNWLELTELSLSLIGEVIRDGASLEQRNAVVLMNFVDVSNSLAKWFLQLSNEVNGQNSRLSEQMSEIVADQLKWAIQVLLHIAPDHPSTSPEAYMRVASFAESKQRLEQAAQNLFKLVDAFNHYLMLSLSEYVRSETIRHRAARAEDADFEFNNLKQVGVDGLEWIATCCILLKELTGTQPSFNSELKEQKRISYEKILMLLGTRVWVSSESVIKLSDLTKDIKTAAIAQGQDDLESASYEESIPGQYELSEADDGTMQAGDPPPVVKEEGEEKPAETVVEEVKIEEEKKIDSPPTPPKEATDEPEEQSTELVEDTEQNVSFLDTDANVRTYLLDQDPHAEPKIRADVKSLADQIKSVLPDSEKAFTALTALSKMQHELECAELRAEQTELRCVELQSQLGNSEDKLRILDRGQLPQIQKESIEGEKKQLEQRAIKAEQEMERLQKQLEEVKKTTRSNVVSGKQSGGGGKAAGGRRQSKAQ